MSRPFEKKNRVLPTMRVSDRLEQALMRLASQEERPLSGYITRWLEKHAFGHVESLELDSRFIDDDRAPQGIAMHRNASDE